MPAATVSLAVAASNTGLSSSSVLGCSANGGHSFGCCFSITAARRSRSSSSKRFHAEPRAHRLLLCSRDDGSLTLAPARARISTQSTWPVSHAA